MDMKGIDRHGNHRYDQQEKVNAENRNVLTSMVELIEEEEEEVWTVMASTTCRNSPGATLSATATVGMSRSESSTRRTEVATRALGVGASDGQPAESRGWSRQLLKGERWADV